MFFLRGRLYKFTFLIHAMDRRSEDSERNRDNSGNRPHTSVSGEQPSTSHLDVKSQPTATSQTCLCMYYKSTYKSITVIQQTTLTYSK